VFGEFELHMPDNLPAVLTLLANGSETAVLAGGTNLLIDLRSRAQQPEHVTALGDIAELRGISIDGDRITLGSRTTITDLLNSPQVSSFAPALVDAAKLFAGQMVRNTGTVGGNIACSSPAADLVPPLLAVDADVALTSCNGERTVALSDYYLDYKKDVRRPDELITAVSWKRLPGNSSNRFYKLARRKGDAITVTGVAVTLSMSSGICRHARIALGAVAPVVMRASKAEAMLEQQGLSKELIAAAAVQAAEECSPITDVRASAEYRRHCVKILVRRLLSQAWESLD
jgi:carbon-monoxide dehydrogenase medium subunit